MDTETLKNVVSKLITTLGATVDDITVTSGHRTIAAVVSPDSKLLIGPHGEHLKALNMLAKRLMERAHGEDATNFLVDINGYHEEQLEKVRGQARMLAQKVRLFKNEAALDPMTAYERLVVHELFAEDPEISTSSAGEGRGRHIVLKYKGIDR